MLFLAFPHIGDNGNIGFRNGAVSFPGRIPTVKPLADLAPLLAASHDALRS